MITGIDMLFVVVCFILLFFLIEIWDRYSEWREWDFYRRRERKHFRYEFRDCIEEQKYRRHLRLMFNLITIETNTHNLSKALNKVSESFRKFNKLFSQ